MEYSRTIVMTKNVNIRFKEGTDLEALAAEFSSYMFEVSTKQLIDYICLQLQTHPSFVEGIGLVEYDNHLKFEHSDEDTVLVYNTDTIDCEVD